MCVGVDFVSIANVHSYLPDVSEAGEKAAEFLHLFMSLTGDVGWKLYLSTKGILHTIGELLSKVLYVHPNLPHFVPSKIFSLCCMYTNVHMYILISSFPGNSGTRTIGEVHPQC